jgi:anti-sigma factor RsiW
MTCEQLRQKLGSYVDGNCSPEELSVLEEHLRGCPQCAAEALSLTQMKQITRTATAARYSPSPQFRLRVEESIGNTKPRKPLFTTAWMPSLVTVAVALLLIESSIVWVRHSDREQAVAELLDLHVATLASANPVDVVSTDRHTVKPWFQGKLPFAFNIPELGNSPFRLLGGKLVYFRHSPGAQLVFTLGKHQLSVFILQDQTSIAAASTREKGFTVEAWSEAGLRYIIISDANPSDVHALSQLLQSAGSGGN